MRWAERRGYPLYTGNDTITPAADSTESGAVTDTGTCECTHNGTGCVISSSAPRYSACHCTAQCRGVVVGCRNVFDSLCVTPGKGFESCLLGSGNCKGYSSSGSLVTHAPYILGTTTDQPNSSSISHILPDIMLYVMIIFQGMVYFG